MHVIESVPSSIQLVNPITGEALLDDVTQKSLPPWTIFETFQQLVMRVAPAETWGKGLEGARCAKRLTRALKDAKPGEPCELESSDHAKLAKFLDECSTWPATIAAQLVDHLEALRDAKEKR